MYLPSCHWEPEVHFPSSRICFFALMFSTLCSECVASNVAHCPVVCNSSTLSVRTNWQTQAVVSSVQIFLACTWLSGKTGWKGQGEGFFFPPMIVIENSTGTQRTNQQPFRLPPSRINGFYKTFPRTARKIKHSNVDSLTETFCNVHVFQLCVFVFIFVYLYVLSLHFGSKPWKAELRTTKHKSVQWNNSELKWLCESSSTSIGLVNQLLFAHVSILSHFFFSLTPPSTGSCHCWSLTPVLPTNSTLVEICDRKLHLPAVFVFFFLLLFFGTFWSMLSRPWLQLIRRDIWMQHEIPNTCCSLQSLGRLCEAHTRTAEDFICAASHERKPSSGSVAAFCFCCVFRIKR